MINERGQEPTQNRGRNGPSGSYQVAFCYTPIDGPCLYGSTLPMMAKHTRDIRNRKGERLKVKGDGWETEDGDNAVDLCHIF